GGEVGAAFGAARLGRLADTGEDPDTVCVAPKVTRIVQPDTALREQMTRRRPLFVRLYQNLKGSFREFAR
ncbi:MAG: xylulokinase, partial [Alphaproteobacteria bacterium]|nr:xylulokinase [Alphaproteobacteria bacterium]